MTNATRTITAAAILALALLISSAASAAIMPASYDFGSDPGKDTIADAGLTTYIQDTRTGEMSVSDVADGISLHDLLDGSKGREKMGFYRTFDGLGPDDSDDFVITTTFTQPNANWNSPRIGIHLFGDTGSSNYWQNGICASVMKNGDMYIYGSGVESGLLVSGSIDKTVSNFETTIEVVGTYGTYGTDNLQLALTVSADGASSTITTTVDTTGFVATQTGFGVSSSQDDTNEYIVDTFSVTPEPATMGLLAMGGLAVLKRRRR